MSRKERLVLLIMGLLLELSLALLMLGRCILLRYIPRCILLRYTIYR